MFYLDNSRLSSLNAHRSLLNEDQLELTTLSFQIDETDASIAILSWLVNGFPKEEFYQMDLNRMSAHNIEMVNRLLENNESAGAHPSRLISETLAKLMAPEEIFIISGYIEDILIDDELCNAVVLAIPEDSRQYLHQGMMDESGHPLIDRGFPMDKIKFGVLIFDTFREDGARISIKGTQSKAAAISMLKDEILSVKAVKDPFHHTKNYLTMCSKFVKERLPEDPSIAKTDQADILNKSLDYFKNQESFTEEKFIEQVFPEEQMSNAFKQYKSNYVAQHQVDLDDDFDISSTAVKNNQRVFKSVLKLDKNFHIYIHGDKKLIQKGADSDGRKFYKIYYELEE